MTLLVRFLCVLGASVVSLQAAPPNILLIVSEDNGPERGTDFAGHRNRIENNVFTDNAPEGGAIIDIQGGTEAITIRHNTFTEARGGKKRELVKQGPDTKQIIVEGNKTKGL